MVNDMDEFAKELGYVEEEPIIQYEVISEKDLRTMKVKEQEWLVDGLIPSNSVGVWTGKRSAFKTFLAVACASSISQGLPFLDRTTRKCKVLYFDKENGVVGLQDKVRMIKQGLGITEDLNLSFIIYPEIKLDALGGQAVFELILEKEKPDLCIIDTYRRFISFDENSAGEVSKLFVDVLKPLVERYKTTILLIHHDRKGSGQGDEMDELRGSSDLPNYADFILKNERKGNTVILKQLKLRNRQESKPIKVGIEFDEETFIKFKNEGDYSPVSADAYASTLIIDWIIKNKKSTFKSGEVKKVLGNIKKNAFYNGLLILRNQGMIEKEMGGWYKVISPEIKLGLQ